MPRAKKADFEKYEGRTLRLRREDWARAEAAARAAGVPVLSWIREAVSRAVMRAQAAEANPPRAETRTAVPAAAPETRTAVPETAPREVRATAPLPLRSFSKSDQVRKG